MKESYTIFLVDDDFIFLEMLKEAISGNPKYNIVVFLTGEECLSNLHLNPDIIVLDYFLNSADTNAKNGMEILKEINKERPNARVIILSGQEDGDLVYKFIGESATDYVIKDDDAFNNVKSAIQEIIHNDES